MLDGASSEKGGSGRLPGGGALGANPQVARGIDQVPEGPKRRERKDQCWV